MCHVMGEGCAREVKMFARLLMIGVGGNLSSYKNVFEFLKVIWSKKMAILTANQNHHFSSC